MTPGRTCPLHYRYSPDELAHAPRFDANCIYVVGGLYGNLSALDAIFELAAHETAPAVIVFNGDFNWFNIDAEGFAAINSQVLPHKALRGNVETELACDDPAAGCGCGYPDFIDDVDVDRSNQIIKQLRATAIAQPALRSQLSLLPMYLTATVGGVNVAIVHGDCESLAGWGLSSEALAVAAHRAKVGNWFTEAAVDVIASSHSCLPVLMNIATAKGTGIVINNGAAGMPNFAGAQHGLITRIGVRPSPHPPLYGTSLGAVHVDALAVHYDVQRWRDDFNANWPPGSAAHASYSRRIESGPRYNIGNACRLTVERTPVPRPFASRRQAPQTL
jgi:hypothetical protein